MTTIADKMQKEQLGARRRRASKTPSSSNMRACCPISSISTARISSPRGMSRSAIWRCARCWPTSRKYLALSAASAPTSPIKQIFESIRDETALTRERAGSRRARRAKTRGDAGPTPRKARRHRLADDRPRSAQSRDEVAAQGRRSAAEVPGASIEANFKPFQVLVDGEAGSRPIDALLANLNELYRDLTLAATNPAQAKQAIDQVEVQVASLRSNVTRLPQPLAGMMDKVAKDAAGDANDRFGRAAFAGARRAGDRRLASRSSPTAIPSPRATATCRWPISRGCLRRTA